MYCTSSIFHPHRLNNPSLICDGLHYVLSVLHARFMFNPMPTVSDMQIKPLNDYDQNFADKRAAHSL